MRRNAAQCDAKCRRWDVKVQLAKCRNLFHKWVAARRKQAPQTGASNHAVAPKRPHDVRPSFGVSECKPDLAARVQRSHGSVRRDACCALAASTAATARVAVCYCFAEVFERRLDASLIAPQPHPRQQWRCLGQYRRRCARGRSSLHTACCVMCSPCLITLGVEWQRRCSQDAEGPDAPKRSCTGLRRNHVVRPAARRWHHSLTLRRTISVWIGNGPVD